MSIAPSQILFLEHGASRLYAEAIQVIAPRRLCWARPTLLIRGLPASEGSPSAALAQARQQMISEAASEPSLSRLQLYDLGNLSEGNSPEENLPDLIWPIELFQIAYDVDFLSLLVHLKMQSNEVAERSGSQHLNDFLYSFWRSQPHVFPQTDLSSNA